MALYLIGLGLWDETDITIKGLHAIKSCSKVYLESYTSRLNSPVEKLEKLYGKKIIIADRELVENLIDEILDNASDLKGKEQNAALLIIGDPLGATTHTAIILRAKERGINVKVVHNASIINAIGITGLELYKFGKITSIPFNNENINSPVEVMKQNQKFSLHTLFLLDLLPKENKYMTINEAVSYLLKNGVKKNTQCIGCAGIGSDKPEIKAGALDSLLNKKFTLLPQCLIIPGKLHFVEEEAIERFR